jgi:hypothetical protein
MACRKFTNLVTGEAMRPIISNIHSALKPLAKWLIPGFKKLPLVEGHFVKNSVDFCQKLGQQTIAADEIMVSLKLWHFSRTHDWLLSLNLEDEKRSAFIEIA